MLLDKFPIYIASTTQVRDEIARFQFYEPAMFFSVKTVLAGGSECGETNPLQNVQLYSGLA